MKTIHLRKLTAIMEVKGRTLFSKNLIIMPAFSLAFTYLIKMIYGNMDIGVDTSGYALSMGVLMNICMTGIYCVAALLAEKKEKHTLRTLMTSSVNGLEFSIGSLLPSLALLIIVNVLCVRGSAHAAVRGCGRLKVYRKCNPVQDFAGAAFPGRRRLL